MGLLTVFYLNFDLNQGLFESPLFAHFQFMVDKLSTIIFRIRETLLIWPFRNLISNYFPVFKNKTDVSLLISGFKPARKPHWFCRYSWEKIVLFFSMKHFVETSVETRIVVWIFVQNDESSLFSGSFHQKDIFLDCVLPLIDRFRLIMTKKISR